jgi:protease-4
MADQKRTLNPLALLLTLSGVFFALFLMISGVMFLYKSPNGSSGSGTAAPIFGGGTVGVVEMNGVIMDSKKTLAKLEKYEENPAIQAVVLRLNSPGGSVAPSQEIYEAVKSYKKPLVVSMGSVAASGAFYIACGAKKVFANPGTITGSIGVIMQFSNLQKLYDWAKIHRYVLKTGKYKDAGAEYREMSDDEKALLQGMIDNVLVQFKTAIATGRKLSMEQVSAIADGRIFSGQQAKSLQLVDELGTIRDAIQEAAKLGNIKGKPHVVYSDKPKRNILDFILEDSSGDESSRSSLSQILTSIAQLSGVIQNLSPASNGLAESQDFFPGLYSIWGQR